MRFWKTRRAATTPQISTPLPALTSLRRLRLCGLFCGARSGENAGHGVVAFVAGIFVDGLVALAHRNNNGERPRPYARIIDGELVHECVGIDTREFLDEAQVRAGVRETCLAFEVDRFNDQRVALPVAPRITPPKRDVPMWTSVERNDPRIVDHLVDDRDKSGTLEQLDIVVVGARGHRRSGIKAKDAALRQRPVFMRVGVGPAENSVVARRRNGVCSLLSFGRHGGIPAIGRVDDQRRSFRSDDIVAAVPPELVVGGSPGNSPAPASPSWWRSARFGVLCIAILPEVFNLFPG